MTKKQPTTFYKRISKEIIWSFFLNFSILFPFYNSLELIFLSSQKNGLFLSSLGFLLAFLLFKQNSAFYDRSINVMFSSIFPLFFVFGEKTLIFFRNSPRILGVFYAFVFLSFFSPCEFAESSTFFFLNAFLVSMRHLSVLPFIGFNMLWLWILSTIEAHLSSHDFFKLSHAELNFPMFESLVFYKIPLLNIKKEGYSLTTKRTMYQWIKFIPKIPMKENIVTTTKYTIGTTTLGSRGLSSFTASSTAEKKAE